MRTARIHPELPAPGLRAAIVRLGSLHLTLWLIALLGASVLASSRGVSDAGWALAAPLALLAGNLAAAIATHPTFRSEAALVVFHLALVVIIVLAAAGRLTYLKGSVELSDGQSFSGALTQREAGPLHSGGLEEVSFSNLGFSVDYQPGMKRGQTRNRVAFGDGAAAVIGDDTPLKLNGYRFYTTSNKGFAPELLWIPHDGGAPARGTIHMPSFPALLTTQMLEWTPPGATQLLHARLEIDESIVDLEHAWVLRPPAAHALQVRAGEVRASLRPGKAQRFADGTLRYLGLRMWMGYTVFYDWTLPWLFAALVVAVAALAWHFAAKFCRQPWQVGPGEGRA